MIVYRSLLRPILRRLVKPKLTVHKSLGTAVSLCDISFHQNTLNILVPFSRNVQSARQDYRNDTDLVSSSKLRLLLELNFESPEDAVPFTRLPIRTLIHIYKTTKDDERNGYCKNRLYYIANRIKCPPAVLSERLAKRTFIYTLSFDWLENSLNILLEMGVKGDRILRDLWVLKYHHKTIHERLQRVKDMGVEILYPWMVRCDEGVLNRFISITTETKDILGEIKSAKLYLANRLGTDLEAVEVMCTKQPALERIRVIKLKPFLDFLLDEGFKVEEIINKPRILTASLRTVKQRLEKLRLLGLAQINLNVLCRSRKAFKKYHEFLEDTLISSKSDNI